MSLPNSDRVRVRRIPKRGHYDAESIDAILDAGFICNVGYTIDGQPYVTPTSHWRIADRVYWHGSSASRMLRALRDGVPACLTVTHVDGLVLARSAFHHSVNYRSVMVLGTATLVADEDKAALLDAFVEKVVPGRNEHIRRASPTELAATMVLSMSLAEASAKVRSGPPIDDEQDHALDCWAGVVPLSVTPGRPEPDPMLRSGIELPKHVRSLVAGNDSAPAEPRYR